MAKASYLTNPIRARSTGGSAIPPLRAIWPGPDAQLEDGADDLNRRLPAISTHQAATLHASDPAGTLQKALETAGRFG
jgi:hypothetical protein